VNNRKAVNPKRAYDSSRRKQKARETRARIVDAASRLFLGHGYGATSVETIAAEAGVAAETVYLQFGTKARLLAALLDVALVGDDEPVPLLDRPWMRSVLNETEPRARLRALASNTRRILEALGPVHAIMRAAALAEPQIAELARVHAERRLEGQANLVDWIAQGAALRPGLNRTRAGEAYFALTSPELHHLFTEELRWSGRRYENWLYETLLAQLLALER
jgi:AcrR family transcriptional regulator